MRHYERRSRGTKVELEYLTDLLLSVCHSRGYKVPGPKSLIRETVRLGRRAGHPVRVRELLACVESRAIRETERVI